MVSLDDEEMQQWMVKSALLAHQQLFRQVLLFCNLDIYFVRIPLEQAGGVALLICITTSIMLVRQVVTASDAALTQKSLQPWPRNILTADNKDSSSVETHLQSSLSLFTDALSLLRRSLFEVYTNRCSLPSLPSQRGPPVSARDGNQLQFPGVEDYDMESVMFHQRNRSFELNDHYSSSSIYDTSAGTTNTTPTEDICEKPKSDLNLRPK
ncbi:unnamed protein product [Brassica napus]|uniref:(rape) hypothetical protein n=1 Tax=Brassica napus TaxID=3708 RepID=A0A816JYY3_BRANA|nr:unnamed protein product [Brassica napus]